VTPPPNERAGRALDVERELDDLVAPYEPSSGPPLRRYALWLGRVFAGAVLALLAVAAIVYILHTHLMQAQTAPAPKKPVTVRIIPAS